MQYIQKKDEKYEIEKEDSVWTMEHFNEYINDHIAPEKGLERDWVFNVCNVRIICILSIREKDDYWTNHELA